jgi:hypothetical protein
MVFAILFLPIMLNQSLVSLANSHAGYTKIALITSMVMDMVNLTTPG